MDVKKTIESNVDQALGAWVDYLNRLRIEELVAKLSEQDTNLQSAIDSLDGTIETIRDQIIETGRGGDKGMHGFIAEIAEVGIGNARKLIRGEKPICEWINDNGPADILIDNTEFQMKFVESGGKFSLNAILDHLDKYPDYIEQGGKYEIPKDFYEAVKALCSMTEEEAKRLSRSGDGFSPRQYQQVKEFFGNGRISIDDIRPSLLEYDEVQQGAIEFTINSERDVLKETDKQIRKQTYDESKPTLVQGLQATAVSASIEGASSFAIAVAGKIREGKSIRDFDQNDWLEIAADTGKGTLKGGVRGASIYTLTNYTATPGAVASSLVTASFGIAEQARMFREGGISEIELYVNAEIVCLDAAVSALSSAIGQAVIPVPVIGAVIGNTVGSIIYQTAKDSLSAREQALLEAYALAQKELDWRIESEYQALLSNLDKDMAEYMALLVKAFDPNLYVALEGSCKLARSLGVSEDEILDTKAKVDSYFMD